jgi:hypothetical protein
MKKKTKKTIVFMDTKNQTVDEDYAEKLRQECRNRLGWKVEKGSEIYDALTEFSKGYSKEKRNIQEVWTIFAIAHGLYGTK